MGAQVSWDGTDLIGTMGYVAAKTSIDLTMGIIGNVRKDLMLTGVADTLVFVTSNKWCPEHVRPRRTPTGFVENALAEPRRPPLAACRAST